MALAKKEENRVSSRIYGMLSLLAAAVLLVVGLASWKTGNAAVTAINEGLVAEKMYFPPSGSPGFDASVFPEAQKYAGKQVTDGALAKAFAEDYLGEQIMLVGGGKTGFEVAAQAAADPGNAGLQQQAGTMFQLGTSKTLLLSAYGSWAQGQMLRSLGMGMLVAAVVMLVVGAWHLMRYKRP